MITRLINTIGVLLLLTTFQGCSNNADSNQTNSEIPSIIMPPDTANNNEPDTLAMAHGDLNSDNIIDLAIVFKRPGEDTISGSVPTRPLKIFFGLNKGTYTLFCSSDSVIMTHDMGGASNPNPFDNIQIKKGVLTVGHHGGMGSFHWIQSVSFKYSGTDKIFYVNKIEKQEGKFSDKPSEAFEEKTVKTQKDFGKLTFNQYNVFDK
jgi:hypothetical protein